MMMSMIQEFVGFFSADGIFIKIVAGLCVLLVVLLLIRFGEVFLSAFKTNDDTRLDSDRKV